MPENIILIGYRGSGKSSVGRKIADQVWKDFVDLDHEICRRFDGRTVAEVWATEGEPAYRAVEVEVTEHFCAKSGQVIALGGGTLMQPGARAVVEQADALRIYLRCDPEELHRRISADPQTAGLRPSLTGQGGGLEEINTVLAEREPVYRAVADVEFDVTFTDIDEAVRHVIARCL